CAKVDGVFFGSDEATGLATVFQSLQFADVSFAIGMVIAVDGFGSRFDAGLTELQHEVLRACDATENNRTVRSLHGVDGASNTPDDLVFEREEVGELPRWVDH